VGVGALLVRVERAAAMGVAANHVIVVARPAQLRLAATSRGVKFRLAVAQDGVTKVLSAKKITGTSIPGVANVVGPHDTTMLSGTPDTELQCIQRDSTRQAL
jgi:hypothetical protein